MPWRKTAKAVFRPGSANAMWNTAGVLYIGFILANAVFLLFADGTRAYFFISLACSLAYILAAGILVSGLIRVLKINGSGESAMIFLSVIYHPVVLLLMVLLKWMIGSV